jgi:hypothetical protein
MSGAAGIGPPEKLSAQHDLSGFDSGEPALDDWLRRRAERNEASGASRTYVVCVGRKVVGYYTLAAGAICPRLGTWTNQAQYAGPDSNDRPGAPRSR